jgi:hypothetical protein
VKVLPAALFAVLLAFATLSPVTSQPVEANARQLDPSTLGMRPNGGFLRMNELVEWERRLDSQINWYVGFAGRMSPRAMRSAVFGQVRHRDAALPKVADRMNLVMTVPLAFGRQTVSSAGTDQIRSNLQETASGAWDEHYRIVARNLVAGGYPDAVIRLGHEFTGGWYPWSAQNNADAYIAAYRHVHQVLASESPQF